MADILMIEGQMMYHSIEGIDDPKEVLEKLATLEPPMGWCHIEKLRAVAYAIWLKEKGMDDWYAYYEKMLQFLGQINRGGTVDFEGLGNMEVPDGWIAPTEYIRGKVN